MNFTLRILTGADKDSKLVFYPSIGVDPASYSVQTSFSLMTKSVLIRTGEATLQWGPRFKTGTSLVICMQIGVLASSRNSDLWDFPLLEVLQLVSRLARLHWRAGTQVGAKIRTFGLRYPHHDSETKAVKF